MTPSEVEKLALDSGMLYTPGKCGGWWESDKGDLARFAELIERAAMQKAADLCAKLGSKRDGYDCAAAIRAAAQKEAT